MNDEVLKEMFSDMIAKPGAGESIAVEEANKIFQQLLRDTMNDNNSSWQVENYLECLKVSDDTFDYFVGRDEATGAASIVVWQTGCMRADFELYGSAIHVDFMARKLNSYDWPYLSLAVIDANGSPRQFGEGIACTERVDAYIAAIKGLLNFTPGIAPEKIDALFADGIMGPSILHPENLNLPNTHFILDCHHLKTDIWPKAFGSHFRDTLAVGLTGMLDAESEIKFEHAHQSILTAYAGNSEILNVVENIVKQKAHFAKYIVQEVPGTAGKRSNNPSEINNSSVIAHLGGALYEDPHVKIKNLLMRQKDLETKRQQEKSEYKLKVQVEIKTKPEIANNDQLRLAKIHLDINPFEMWKKEYYESTHYEMKVVDGGTELFHLCYPDKIRFVATGERCHCRVRKCYYTQCRHEILMCEGKFRLNMIAPRNHFHPKVLRAKRNSDIAGTSFTDDVGAAAMQIDAELDTFEELDDNEIVFKKAFGAVGGPVEPITEPDVSNTNSASDPRLQTVSTNSKTKKTSFSDIMKVFKETADMAVKRGKEDIVFGTAIQLLNCMKTGGDVLEGGLSDVIDTFHNTFVSVATSKVSFSLTDPSTNKPRSHEPQKPPSKP